jgi:hypothetical protein
MLGSFAEVGGNVEHSAARRLLKKEAWNLGSNQTCASGSVGDGSGSTSGAQPLSQGRAAGGHLASGEAKHASRLPSIRATLSFETPASHAGLSIECQRRTTMAPSYSLPVTHGYFITPEGHEALTSAEECVCTVHLAGLLFECPECGTVYGSLRDQDASRYARQDKPL